MPTARLNHYLSRIIYVKLLGSETEEPLPFRLVGIEDFGLWLENMNEGSSFVASRPPTSFPRIALFPFTQIGYVVSDGAYGAPTNGRSQHSAEEPKQGRASSARAEKRPEKSGISSRKRQS